MDLDGELRSTRRVRAFDPVDMEAPRRPYFNDSFAPSSASWERVKSSLQGERQRSGSLTSPRPPRRGSGKTPTPVAPSTERSNERRRSKSAAGASVISISSTSEDDDKSDTFSSASSSDSTTSTDSSSGSSSGSSTTSSASSSTSSSSSGSTGSSDSDSGSSGSASESSTPADNRNTQALVQSSAGESRWRPSYNEEGIAAAAAASAILARERELKEMELELIQEKRNFAKEVKRRASGTLLFDREDDALAQMQRLVALEGGDISFDDYLAATERTATFLEDGAARGRASAPGVSRQAARRSYEGAADESHARGAGINRVSAYQAQQRLMGSSAVHHGALDSASETGSEGSAAGALNDSRTARRVRVNAGVDEEEVYAPPQTQQQQPRGQNLSNEWRVPQLPLKPLQKTATTPLDLTKAPAQAPYAGKRGVVPLTVTLPSDTQKSKERREGKEGKEKTESKTRSRPSTREATPSAAVISSKQSTPSESRTASVPRAPQKKTALPTQGTTITLTAASPLDEQLSPSGPASGVASPARSGTPAAVFIHSDHHRSDTSASPNEVAGDTPEPRVPKAGATMVSREATASTSCEGGVATDGPNGSTPLRPGRTKKKVRVRVRRRSRSRRKSRMSVATETETEAETASATPQRARHAPHCLSPTPLNDGGGGVAHRGGWLMPPPAEAEGVEESKGSRYGGYPPGDLSHATPAGPQYVQLALPGTGAAAQGNASNVSTKVPTWAAAPANWPMSEPPAAAAASVAPAAPTSTAAQSLRYLTSSGPVTDRQFKKLLCAEYVPVDDGASGQRQGYEPFGGSGSPRRPSHASSRPSHAEAGDDDDSSSFIVNSPPSSEDEEEATRVRQHQQSQQQQPAANVWHPLPSQTSAAALFTTEAPLNSPAGMSLQSAPAAPSALAAQSGISAQPAAPVFPSSFGVTSHESQRFTALNDSAPPQLMPEDAAHVMDSDGSVLEFPPPPPTRVPDMPPMDRRPVRPTGAAGTPASRCCCSEASCCCRFCHWWSHLCSCIFCCCCNARKRNAADARAVNNATAEPAHASLGLGAVAPLAMPSSFPEESPSREAVMR